MKVILQKPDDGAYTVPRPGVKSRWLQFLIVLLLLAANAGVVKAQNSYWYNEFNETGSVSSDIKTYWKNLGDANPNITSEGTVYIHILTYESGGNPHGSHSSALTVSINGIDIWKIDYSSSSYRHGRNPRYLIPELIGLKDSTFQVNSRYYRTLRFKLSPRFWGSIGVGFKGYWDNRAKNIDFTKTLYPSYYAYPSFPYGNKPNVEEGKWVAKDKISLTFQRLPNLAYANNYIVLPNGDKRETLPNPNFPATITHIYNDVSNPGVSKTLSDMKSEIKSGTKTDTYFIPNFNLLKLPSIENLKPTFSQTNKNVLVKWDVNRISSQRSSLDRVAILRKEKTASAWSRVTTVNVSDSTNLTNYSITDTGIAFDKEYDYAAVYYQDSQSWLGASLETPIILYESGITGLHTTGSVSTTVKHNINLTGDFDLNDGAVLTWNSEKSDIFVPSSFQILRNGTLHKTIAYDINKDSYEYKDTTIKSSSTTYKYQIKHVVNRTNTLVKNFLSNEVSITSVQSAKIIKTHATKGEYPGIVKLSWDVQNYSNGNAAPRTQYIISRRSLESSNNEFAEIYRTSSTEDFLTYTDDRVLPGIYYEYEFKWIARVNNTDIPGSVKNIGFAQSSGNVSGRISYGTGTAVEGVNVMLKPTNAENDITASRSLRFLGTGSYAKWDLGNRAIADSLLKDNDYSIQMWVRPEYRSASNNALTVQTGNSNLVLGLSYVGNSTYMLKITTNRNGSNNIGELYLNEYSHITMVKSGNQYKFYIKHLVNDGSGTFTTVTKTITLDPYLLSSSSNSLLIGNVINGFAGYVDEFRFWTKALTESEINKNFDRLLAGNEAGLYAYWRFDEGLTTMFFDASRKGSVMNGNHGTIVGTGVQSTTIIPSDVELSLKAITDKDGNYLVSGIPFGGEGTSYSVTPMMGIHKFQPSQSLRFIGANALVHNGTDFTDISSFPVTGKVTYAGGEYPVEGAQLLIDGVAASKNGQLIQTDEKGEFTIDVPIGDHFISVSKNGHTFANKGRFPALENEKHTFVKPENIDFQDQTLVKIAGRVSGGEREGTKPVGFGQSKANIGKATVVLNPVDDRYQLNTGTADKASNGDNTSIKSNSVIQSKKTTRQIVIETDEETGEYLAMLPPVEYKVIDVFTKDNNGATVLDKEDFKVETIAQFTPEVLKVETDSATINGVERTFEYHKKLDVNYRVDPAFEVTDANTRRAVFGDSIYTHKKSNGTSEKIKLYSVTNGVPTYTLGYPVFTKLTPYAWRVFGYEKYTNAQTGAEDLVPLKDAQLNFDNALASTTVFVEQNDSLQHEPGELQLNESGVGIYRFHAGFPNMSNDHLLAAKFTYDHIGKTITWPATGTFKGYVFGDIPVPGSNFVTQGPDVVDYILRDPSGSNSASYLEKGSIISNTITMAAGLNSESTYELSGSLGTDQQVATGFGVAVILRTLFKDDRTFSLSKTSTKEFANTETHTTEILQRISTSSSPDYVGPMADVYIGQSTNLIFGKTNKLGLFPTENTGAAQSESGNSYALNNKEVLSTGADFTTTFNYTQNHIINYLIPNIRALRNSLIKLGRDSVGYVNNDTAAVYFSRVPVADERFGLPGTYKIVPPAVSNGKPVIDRVSAYNSWIESWEQSIAQNEKAKIESFKKTPNRNLSFDAGTTIDQSINQIVTKIDTQTSNSEIIVGMSSVTGYEFAGVGINLAKSSNYGIYLNKETGEEKTDSRMFGFTLGDESQGDYYTIDVYEPVDNSGYIFKTRGGQSSCPYEGPEYTQYYEPEKKHELSAGTFQIEKPAIYVNNSKNASAENISSGREATLELQLSNLSEANMPVTYQLFVREGSNPDGLIFSIDGTPLANPRSFQIAAGSTITKTLKVRQSSLDILEYKDIALLFTSTCQNDPGADMGWIADSARVNVTFVPSSSPLTLKLPTTLINKEDGNPKITYQVSDYERNFKNFASIRLQYKNENSQNWSLAHEFVNNKTLVPLTADNTEITGPTFSYNFDVKNLPDARYDVRAVAVSKIGTDEITTVTPTQKVIKDVVAPQVLGKPAPVTDILTPEGEISVMFNEDILSSYITDNFITVKGVLNGHKIDHNVAAKFNGNPAYTEASVALAGNSFTVEGWVKRTPGETGTFVAHDNLQIGFTSDNKLSVKIGNESFTSVKTLPTANWQYISFAYNNENRTFSAYGLYEAVTETLFANQPVQSAYQGAGRLYVGANADNSNPFNGAVHNLALWNKTRLLSDLSDRDKTKVGNEKGLIGYWNLTEGHGTIAADIARSRQLTLPSTNNWYLNNINHALDLDGTKSVQIPSGTIPVTENENFAIELWFNGADQANATLLSAGDGISDLNNAGKLSIGFNADKKLTLRTKGASFEMSNKNFLDGKWHHLALNVVRGGFATVYVDGNLEKQITASNIGAVESGEISLGSSKYITQGTDGMESKNENFFKGKLDEVRVWKSTLSASMFNLNRYNRLVGNETGLAAYYPFERVKVDSITNRNETEATLKGFTEGVASDGTITGTASYESVNVPPLKEARVTEKVNHTFTVSKDKVVINITEPAYRIEGRTLEMVLERVQDLNGNVIKPIIWTAFINLNRLTWSEDAVNVTKEHLSDKLVEVTISNQSGKEENWAISNVPAWLGVSKTQGTLKPLSSQKIVLTFLPSAPIGSYEENIYLTGNNQIEAPLGVSLKVTGAKPDWNFNPNEFETSMNVVGSLKVDGQLSEDQEDILAAFIDDKCVGFASPTYVKNLNTYLVMLNVYGNENTNGKQVTFKVWDASTGRTYPIVTSSETIISRNEGMYGGLYNPVVFDAANQVQLKVNLNKGWNWISFNVEHVDMSLKNIFTTAKAKTELIKDKASVALPTSTGWDGVLNTIQVGKMYKVKNMDAAQVSYIGKSVNSETTAINLVKGWNWIGFTPQATMPTSVALADANPQAGDVIKSKTSFAVYSGTEWVGLLKYLTPGTGYLYQSAAKKDFYYPNNYIGRAPMLAPSSDNFNFHPNRDAYSSNMILIAKVVDEGGNEISDMELGAFVGLECRGTEITRDNNLIYLTIAGDDASNDVISFKVFDRKEGVEGVVKDQFMKFENDAFIGTRENPYIIKAPKILSGVDNQVADKISVSPTLVNDKLFVKSADVVLKRIVIADINGKIVYKNDAPQLHNEIRMNDILKGVYFVEIITQENNRKVERIIKN